MDNITVVYGYPAATSAALTSAVTGLAEDWKVVVGYPKDNTIAYTYNNNDSDTACIVTYTQAQSVSQAASTTITFGSGCNSSAN